MLQKIKLYIVATLRGLGIGSLIGNVKNYVYLQIKWGGCLTFPINSSISRKAKFEGANTIGGNSAFNGEMGYGSYIGSNCHISGKVGRYTSIAGHCRVIYGRHTYKEPFATTCPMFFSLKRQNGHTFANRQLIEEFKFAAPGFIVTIGSDCWIGDGVRIVQGVSVGDGAMVLAGAVVTKNIPPYAIAGGVPAKIIGYRYDDETIRFLLRIQWWNNSLDWLEHHWNLLTNIGELKDYYKQK